MAKKKDGLQKRKKGNVTRREFFKSGGLSALIVGSVAIGGMNLLVSCSDDSTTGPNGYE